ncbi:DUF1285 domain-containing protein [Shewanella marina]|uniref:DUF1285 domain-containing protein n=1 Tax=Shewanella marina TaxID=487319 RepID=UPI00046E952D|nr:DUF1285 domain-containing protein [Shewanella marina]
MDSISPKKLLEQLKTGLTEVDTALFYIDSQGRWFYQNEVLPTKFAQLFWEVLQYKNDEYRLKTAKEDIDVIVTTYPIMIIDYQRLEDGSFELFSSIDTRHRATDFKIDDEVIYFNIERQMRAGLTRACYYHFVEEVLLNDERAC